MINRSLQGISGLMEPRITALRRVEGLHRFDPLLVRQLWWDEKEGDDSLRRRHNQKGSSGGMIGYGRNRKKRPMTMAPPAENLEKRYRLQDGEGLRMAGQGLGMTGGGGMSGEGSRMYGQGCGGCQSGRGLPIRLSNPASMRY